MNKRKKPPVRTELSFQDYLKSFPGSTIQSAVVQLNDSIAWALLKSYLKVKQREFEVVSLDLVRNNTTTHAAAHASGYAQACEDVAERFMQNLIDAAAGVNGLVEGSVPEAE